MLIRGLETSARYIDANGALTSVASRADNEFVEGLASINTYVNEKAARERSLLVRDGDCATRVMNDL